MSSVKMAKKEAKQNYQFEKLVDYCVALANEGGGKIILGVTDKRPRRIVGTAVRYSSVSSRAAWKSSAPAAFLPALRRKTFWISRTPATADWRKR